MTNRLTRLSGALANVSNVSQNIAMMQEKRQELLEQRQQSYASMAFKFMDYLPTIKDTKIRYETAKRTVPLANSYLKKAFPGNSFQFDPESYKTDMGVGAYEIVKSEMGKKPVSQIESQERNANIMNGLATLGNGNVQDGLKLFNELEAMSQPVQTSTGETMTFGGASELVKGSGGGMQITPGSDGYQVTQKTGGGPVEAQLTKDFNEAVEKEVMLIRKGQSVTPEARKQIIERVLQRYGQGQQQTLRSLVLGTTSAPGGASSQPTTTGGQSSSPPLPSFLAPAIDSTSQAPAGVAPATEPKIVQEMGEADTKALFNLVESSRTSARAYDTFYKVATKYPKALGAIGGLTTELKGKRGVLGAVTRSALGSNEPYVQQLSDSLKEMVAQKQRAIEGARGSDQDRAYYQSFSLSTQQDTDAIGTMMNGTGYLLDKAIATKTALSAKNISPDALAQIDEVIKNLSVELQGLRVLAETAGKRLNKPMDRLPEPMVKELGSILRGPLTDLQASKQYQDAFKANPKMEWKDIIEMLPMEVRPAARSLLFSRTQLQQVSDYLEGTPPR